MKTRSHIAALAAGVFALGTLAATPVLAEGKSQFKNWDADSSGTIDRDEFMKGSAGTYESWRGEKPALTRQDWHARIGNPETMSDPNQQAFDADSIFDDWASDPETGLQEEEMGEGWFQSYDRDANEELDEEEFGRFEEEGIRQRWFE